MEALGKKYNAVLQQTMLRIKDPKVSVPFYEKHFEMQLVHKYDFPQWKFSLYFLERPSASFECPSNGAVQIYHVGSDTNQPD